MAKSKLQKHVKWEQICTRCGKCCYLVDETNQKTTIPCPYLRFDKQQKAVCTIYHHRVGTYLGTVNNVVNMCCLIQDAIRPSDCAYNIMLGQNQIMNTTNAQNFKIEILPTNSSLIGLKNKSFKVLDFKRFKISQTTKK